MSRKKLQKLHARTLTAFSYNKKDRTVTVRFSDDDLAVVTLEALKLPSLAIESIQLDEFRTGLEFTFPDGSMHDVAADYITWLTKPEYADAYPTDDTLGPRVGAAIVKLRKQRNLSQAALAERLEMAPPNLSRLESGKHVPSLDVLLRVANVLEVPLSALLAKPSALPSHEVLIVGAKVKAAVKTRRAGASQPGRGVLSSVRPRRAKKQSSSAERTKN